MTMKATPAFLLAALAAAAAASAQAQSAPAAVPPDAHRAEIALDYSYLHTNAPPGGCGCFSMNGFTAQLGWPVDRKGISGVGELNIAHTANAAGTNTSFTLGSFGVGARYRIARGGWVPFGEIMAGAIQATGGYNKIGITSPASAGLSFAGIVGGGLDRRITTRLYIRLIEADYFATTFDNGSNNHQNNFRINAGLAWRF
jgi:outer membrane immunogenic protein